MSSPAPVRLTGPSALRWGVRFARDPLTATRDCFDAFGGFVMLADAVPLLRPRGVAMLGVPLVLTAGAAFHRELLSDPTTWRGVSLLPGGPRHSAARRMSAGINRMTGSRHAHYRGLIGPVLRKARVAALTSRMAALAETEVASWRIGEPLELWELTRALMRRFAIELLFGGDPDGYRIADLVSALMESKWSRGAFVPINLPITPYGRVVRMAEALERELLAWAAAKRGRLDDHDIGSIIVNSPDAYGAVPSDAAVAGQMPSLFAAASEAGQSALIWTLVLITLHPRVASALVDELRGSLGGATPALDAVGELPYLDAAVKESMRILPPVPLQIRVAQSDAAIAGHAMPKSTRVMLNTFLVNRMPDLYPEGDVFRPERWRDIKPNAFEFPVFSAGPHSCPGYWFGMTAVKMALAAILTRYRLKLGRDAPIDYRVQPTMRPLKPLFVELERQDGVATATPISGSLARLVQFP